jgi:molybdopterin adenylyltransferase
MKIRVGIIVLSDKATQGEREDRSGPVLRDLVEKEGWEAEQLLIIPDEKDQLRDALLTMIDSLNLDLVLTSGGTGLGPRDITPDVTAEVIEKLVSGIAEILRVKGYGHKPTAVLSRGLAGIRGKSLIINLPGSPKAVREVWPILREIIPHAIEVLRGEARECGSGNTET